ncbi:MAG: hypothetical protein LH614_07770 [Pyrinomonadaceae bacterium]|nr:hypothetical protein [Pyrinomonadaceae bacterium]
MKISRTSVKMIILALVFYLAWYYAVTSSRQYRIEKERETKEKYGFIVSHGSEELNHWDYAVISFMVLAMSSTIVAFWVRKFDS